MTASERAAIIAKIDRLDGLLGKLRATLQSHADHESTLAQASLDGEHQDGRLTAAKDGLVNLMDKIITATETLQNQLVR